MMLMLAIIIYLFLSGSASLQHISDLLDKQRSLGANQKVSAIQVGGEVTQVNQDE